MSIGSGMSIAIVWGWSAMGHSARSIRGRAGPIIAMPTVPHFIEPCACRPSERRSAAWPRGLGARKALMSKINALISDDRPVIRIYDGDTNDYVEIGFQTQNDANVAVEQLNELFKRATGLVLSSGMRGT